MTTVVLLHGIRTSATMWRRQVAALEAAGVATLAPDLPGHGTRSEEDFTVDGAVRAIEEVVAGVDGPVVVVGLSMGGYLALHWAGTTTRRPAAVVAASCCTRPRGVGLVAYRRLARWISHLPDAGAGLNDAMARRFLPAEGVVDVAAGGMALGVMDAALAGIAGIDPIEDLRRIDAPVWLVNGRFDHFRLEEKRYLAACRDGRLVIIPGGTHLVSLTHPVAFNRVLLDVVASVDEKASVS